MEYKKGNRFRRQALEENKTLNKTPDKVLDANFKNIEFFDPDDILQVKYEMLRYSEEDGVSVLNAAKTYGFSRISFYKISKAFKEEGLAGLFPNKRGPRRAHKLNGEVMEFVNSLINENPSIRSSSIKERIRGRFNITVHERSIERAILRGKKKQQNN
jgi:transposase